MSDEMQNPDWDTFDVGDPVGVFDSRVLPLMSLFLNSQESICAAGARVSVAQIGATMLLNKLLSSGVVLPEGDGETIYQIIHASLLAVAGAVMARATAVRHSVN